MISEHPTQMSMAFYPFGPITDMKLMSSDKMGLRLFTHLFDWVNHILVQTSFWPLGGADVGWNEESLRLMGQRAAFGKRV